MGIAVPSLAEASRRLPSSVKADPADADDVLVTSVAIAPTAIDEPVSPELALVDPELRERLRALLPEIELDPPASLLRALPDPEPDEALPLAPPPELVESPAPATAVFSTPQQVPVYVYPTRVDRFRSFTKAFLLGAAAATVITVGVIAERDEGPVAPEDAGTAPPTVAAPVPAPTPTPKVTSGGTGAPKTTKKPASAPSSTRAKHANAKEGKTQAASPAKTQRAATNGTAKAKTAGQAGRSKATPPPAASAEPKRFAWAPVDGAVGYRFELFRGNKQVLEVRTKTPAYELARRWRHAGRAETLTKGEYRWFVWPLLPSGPAAAAVVQARLSVP
jgi:hypothetical protein